VPGVHVGVSHVLDWKWHLHATLTQGLGAQCLEGDTAIWRMCIDEPRQYAPHDKRGLTRAGCCCIPGNVCIEEKTQTPVACPAAATTATPFVFRADDSGRREGYEYSAGSGCARLPWHLPSALATSFAAFIRLP
jgi:hypothetical protein